MDNIYSALHYASKAEKSFVKAENEADRAKGYADSINPDSLLNKQMITNCITEIPQDIKLELKDGVLTLKAGSKVYVPNGDGKFDEVVTSSDFTLTSNGKLEEFVFLERNGASITHFNKSLCSSGATQPTVTTTYWIWYDTTNNAIKYTSDNGSTWVGGFSLPISIVKVDGLITSIDQVFNGFGYIGSTVFALPGVKGLIPNGRNADGTLKNTEFTVDKVIKATSTTPMDFYFAITPYSLTSGGGYMVSAPGYTTSETPPSTNRWFKPSENMYYLKTNGVWIPDKQVHVGFGVNTANAITSFTPKLPFRAVDYSEMTSGAIPTVVEFTQTAEAWYRLWSDGTLEQGGRCWVGDVGSNGTVNFLKAFADVPMACGSKIEYGSFSESSGCIHSISTTGIAMGLRWGGDNSRGGRYCSFYAIGKAAK